MSLNQNSELQTPSASATTVGHSELERSDFDLKIERIENPTPEFFQEHISPSRKPVIITGVVNNWQIYSRWTSEYLIGLLGDREIPVCASENSIVMVDSENGFDKFMKQMKFRNFIELLKPDQDSTDKNYYYTRAQILKLFPELMEDIELPIYCENQPFNEDYLINLWMGSSGTTTTLHYDLDDNLLAQVRGKKRVILLDPEQTNFIYPFPANSKSYHFSQIPNIDKPDLLQFPKCQQAKSYEIILEPGEMLFIPAFWWHQVYTLNSPQFPIISVNFWWKPPLMTWFTTSPGRRYTAQMPNILKHRALRLRKKLTRKIKAKLSLKK